MMHSLWMIMTDKNRSWVEEFEKDEELYFNNLKQLNKFLESYQNIIINQDNKNEKRQKEILHLETLEISDNELHQKDSQNLWNTLHYNLITDKVSFRGKDLTKHDSLKLLKELNNPAERKELWISYMTLGKKIAPGLVELVKLRNKIAKEKGFTNFYELKLYSQELNADSLNDIIDELRNKLDPIYSVVKKNIDRRIRDKFRIKDGSPLKPWHYMDPYFQKYQKEDWDLKKFKQTDFLKQILNVFKAYDIQLEEIVARSYFTEDKNKSPESFCLNIDRNKDIRISCNIDSDINGLKVILHELGHAVYEEYLGMDLPFLLKQPSSIFLSEGIALLFERLIMDSSIQDSINLDVSIQEKNFFENILVNLYWTITVVKFEQELYVNPDQDLNKLWWELVEDIQQISPSDDPNILGLPVWATKSHLTTLPVYYQNYLLGQVLASQFEFTLNKVNNNQWFSQEGIVKLKENIFSLGKLYPWKAIVKKCTGMDMNPEFLINQLTKVKE